jgi:DNA-nicking Smr family endonuclease
VGNDDDKLGHRPFGKLKALRDKIPVKAKAPPPKAAPKPKAQDDDAFLFAQAMHDVQRFAPAEVQPLPATKPGKLPEPDAENEEVRQHLKALVRGEQKFDLSDTDEFVEGAVEGFDRRTRDKLKRGELSVQAHLDLHGLVREEAHAAVERFIRDQRHRGARCVLIIHGRGLNSKGQVPVLKEQMGRWLTRGAVGRSVLAFCTARPSDGGAGAIYVLLRR